MMSVRIDEDGPRNEMLLLTRTYGLEESFGLIISNDLTAIDWTSIAIEKRVFDGE
jgi:hypothetical protein